MVVATVATATLMTTPALAEPERAYFPKQTTFEDAVNQAVDGIVPGECDTLHDAATLAGWSEDEWPGLRLVMKGESGCNPAAHYVARRDDSWGLTQINTKGKLLGARLGEAAAG